MSAKITLTNGEEREVVLNTRALYEFEQNGGSLSKAGDMPITTMVDLAIAGIGKVGESRQELLGLMPAFGEVSKAVTAAMQESGLGESEETGTAVSGDGS